MADDPRISEAVDKVIAQIASEYAVGVRKPRRLVERCRIQSAVANHLERLHQLGVVGRYKMPCVHEDGARGVTIHSDFDYISEEDRQ